jgi:hypothetical protein
LSFFLKKDKLKNGCFFYLKRIIYKTGKKMVFILKSLLFFIKKKFKRNSKKKLKLKKLLEKYFFLKKESWFYLKIIKILKNYS